MLKRCTLQQAKRLKVAKFDRAKCEFSYAQCVVNPDDRLYDNRLYRHSNPDDHAPAPNSDELIHATIEHDCEVLTIVKHAMNMTFDMNDAWEIILAAMELWTINHSKEPFELCPALVDLYCKLAEVG